MVLSSGGPNNAFVFTNVNGDSFTSITSGFTTGLNTLLVIVNDTNSGITGNLSGGINCQCPTEAHFIGEVTFDEAVVAPTDGATPLPAALPLFATGLGALGLLGWRRKRKAQAVA